jgi:hypothetical protein
MLTSAADAMEATDTNETAVNNVLVSMALRIIFLLFECHDAATFMSVKVKFFLIHNACAITKSLYRQASVQAANARTRLESIATLR